MDATRVDWSMGSQAARLADWDVALAIGRRVAGPGVRVAPADRARMREDFAELVTFAEERITDFTSLDPGGTVTLTIAQQAERVSVPFVVGLSQRDALNQLRVDGLKGSVRERDVDDESQDGVVLEQRPSGDTGVDSGSSVVLIVGRFVAPTPPPTTPDESP